MDHLAQQSAFPGLKVLNLGYCRLTPRGIATLFDGPGLQRVEDWRFSTDKLRAAAIDAMLAGSNCAGTRALRFVGCSLGEKGVLKLNSPALQGLEMLNLYENGVTNKAVKTLAESPHLRQLKGLRFRYDKCGTPAILAIASSPSMAQLEVLQMSQCGVAEEDARAIASSHHLHKLRHLNLSTTRIEPRDHPNAEKLQKIGLWQNPAIADPKAVAAAAAQRGDLQILGAMWF